MGKKESKPRHEPFGRPTKYDPKYCQMLIEHMASGLSFESFSAVINVTISTLYEWEKAQPNFSEAKKEAYGRNLLFWEDAGREGLWDQTEYKDGKPVSKRSLNSAVWIFNMKNRHRWRDKQEVEIKESEENRLAESFKNMSVEQLLKIARESQDNE